MVTMELISLKELANNIGLSYPSICRYAKLGMPHQTFDKLMMVNEAEATAWLEKRREGFRPHAVVYQAERRAFRFVDTDDMTDYLTDVLSSAGKLEYIFLGCAPCSPGLQYSFHPHEHGLPELRVLHHSKKECIEKIHKMVIAGHLERAFNPTGIQADGDDSDVEGAA